MYNTAYNKKIADEVDRLNNRYIKHMESDGGYIMNDRDIVRPIPMHMQIKQGREGGASMSQGGSFLDKIPVIGSFANMMGLGDNILDDIEGMGRRRGGYTGYYQQQLAKGMTGRPMMKASGINGGSFLDKIPLVGSFAHMFGLGLGDNMEGGKKKRTTRKTPVKKATKKTKKGGNDFLSLGRSPLKQIPIVGPILSGILGFGEQGELLEGGKKKRATKKGGNDLIDDISGIANMFSMQGDNPLDQLIGHDTAYNISKDIATEHMGLGKKKKMTKAKEGTKKAPSKWIMHVKNYAKSHGMKYNEALKDPKCSKSYKK